MNIQEIQNTNIQFFLSSQQQHLQTWTGLHIQFRTNFMSPEHHLITQEPTLGCNIMLPHQKQLSSQKYSLLLLPFLNS